MCGRGESNGGGQAILPVHSYPIAESERTGRIACPPLVMRDALAFYKTELLRWTAKVNLIGPEAKEHLDEHIAEALTAAEILQPSGEVLDFGSGGGLPAIPMAIVSPEARFHLVEADQRKWAFLKHIVRECGLSCRVYGDRLSRLLPRLPADLRFSLV